MVNDLYIFFFLAIFLFIINILLKKFSINLDTISKDEIHKSLLRSDNSTPLSGTYFFLPILIYLFYQIDIILVIFCSLFFLIGLLSDVKLVSSYKLRLIAQFLLLSFLFFTSKEIIINTRVSFLDNLMNYDVTRIIVCTFFFMVLINGFNLIDGTNCLCCINLLVIVIFIFLLCHDLNIEYLNSELKILILSLIIFLLFNFFGKNFLGDGAAYGLGFLVGYILVNIAIKNNTISPYFVANLLWYPAFENLFSILRRNFSHKNNYLPDNNHLHQLIFKYLKIKKFTNKTFLLSSIVGIIINLVLFIFFYVGYIFYNHTVTQVFLILSGIFLYLITYYTLSHKLK